MELSLYRARDLSKELTSRLLNIYTHTHSILEAGLLVSLRSYFQPLVKHSTPTQNTQVREAGSVPAPSPLLSSPLFSTVHKMLLPSDSHPRGFNIFHVSSIIRVPLYPLFRSQVQSCVASQCRKVSKREGISSSIRIYCDMWIHF